ncbi:MAG: hypothetical protein WB873_09480 [Thermoplasmata archaeon]
METRESPEAGEWYSADCRVRSVNAPSVGEVASSALQPRFNRLVRGLYPLPDSALGGLGGPVSPFRLPREIELALWRPLRLLAVLPGTATHRTDPTG